MFTITEGRKKKEEGEEKKKGKPEGFPTQIPAASYFPTTSRLQYHRPWRA